MSYRGGSLCNDFQGFLQDIYIYTFSERKGWFLLPTSLWSVLYWFEEFVTVSAYINEEANSSLAEFSSVVHLVPTSLALGD